MNTAFHAKLFAHELSLVQAGDSVNRLSQAMFDACIDLNPHQISAAIFALKNPLSKGCILADEVGLGKTIETGLVISQMWAEGKRSMLIIAPKSLRHQWKDELKNLFFLESEIMSGQDFKKLKNSEKSSPIKSKEKIIITNEHSVDSYHEIIKSEKWDLIIIDEAHKLRNVWKKGKNEAKRAKRIKEAIKPFKKLLLTATPMQNNLMELYGLASFIDDYTLGTRESFQSLFCNISDTNREERMSDLQSRMKGFFKRELRKNVLEYINYTNRNTITFTYDPTDDEEELRILFENFLRRELLISVPASALPLLTLVYLKLIASSTFAIKNSLKNLYKRLLLICVSIDDETLFNDLYNDIKLCLTENTSSKSDIFEKFNKNLYGDTVTKNFCGLKKMLNSSTPVDDITNEEKEFQENYSDQDLENSMKEDDTSTLYHSADIKEEATLVLKMITISLKIEQNKKADALIEALTKQFEKARNEGWPEKAVIFTEFRSTQDYILRKLTEMGIKINDEVVIFNGDSGDAENRRTLVKQFKDTKKIFLTTEAGSEGLNLQFCNLLINYDLPWNPQRIEQRIGRCHRYGQKLDVIVVNFVNTKNVADLRVLELLQEKFTLFKGAFGASDEVLGDIEDGHDVEKEILNIYMSCRSKEEINEAFKNLQFESSQEISEKLNKTKGIVLENFDEDVHTKLKMQLDNAENRVDLISKMFWALTVNVLNNNASFNSTDYTFDLKTSPFKDITNGIYKLGPYKMISKGQERVTDSQSYRLGHPLGEKVIDIAKNKNLDNSCLTFNLTKYENKVTQLEYLIGKMGWIEISLLNVQSLDHSEELIYLGVSDDGEILSPDTIRKIFNIDAIVSEEPRENFSSEVLNQEKLSVTKTYLNKIEVRNHEFFNEESEKLDKWSEDIKEGLELDIKELDKEIRKVKKESKTISLLEEKIKAQRLAKSLETKRNTMRKKLYEEQDRIEEEKEQLISEIEVRMKLKHSEQNIFRIEWKII